MSIRRMLSSRACRGGSGAMLALLLAASTFCSVEALAGPRVSVGSATVTEGIAGARELVFTIFADDPMVTDPRHRALEEPIVVEYRTMDLTAQVVRGDYEAVSGTVRFDRLGVTEEVRVPIFGDALYEANETLAFDLVQITGATSDYPRGIGTILNDEAPPSLAIGDVTAIEGNGGVVTMTFAVTLSQVSGVDTEVDVATADGTARAGDGDYQAFAQRIVIPIDATSRTVTVNVMGEALAEVSETFTVELANPADAVISRGAGIGTILNDDLPLGPNMVDNWTFDPDLTGWRSLGPCHAMACKDHPGPSGPHAAMVETHSYMGDYGLEDIAPCLGPALEAGARYRLAAWVWGNESNGTAFLRIRESLNGRLIAIHESAPVQLDAVQYQWMVADVAARHAGSTLRMQIINSPVAPSEKFHIDDVSIQRFLPGDIPPDLTVSEFLTIKPGVRLDLDVVASDADGQVIDVLAADLSDFPADNQPVFVPNADNAGGRLTWTPREADLRTAPYAIEFTAVNSSAVSRVSRLQVVTAPGNIAQNGGFEQHLGGWHTVGLATMDRVPGAKEGSWVAEVARQVDTGELPIDRGPGSPDVIPSPEPAPDGSFGIGDWPEWVPIVASAGATYHFSAWVRSADAGVARLHVAELGSAGEYLGGVASEGVALATEWKTLTVSYTARNAGTSLSLQILDTADSPTAMFQVDQVGVQLDRQVAGSTGGGGRKKLPDGGIGPVSASVQPNPVRTAAVLAITLNEAGPLHAALFDLSGRRVAVFADGQVFPVGAHRFDLNGSARLAQGIYFYRVRSATGESEGRFVVLD